MLVCGKVLHGHHKDCFTLSPLAALTKMAAVGEEEGLKCQLCCGIYQALKLLPCGDLFCESCLKEIDQVRKILSKDGVEFPLACPKCCETTLLPSGSVVGLPNTFFFKKEVCARHDPEKELFYCSQCNVPMCEQCMATNHDKHPTEDLGKVLLGAKTELKKSVVRLGKFKTLLEKQRFQCQQNMVCFDDRLRTLKEHAQQRAAELIAIVQECSDQFIRDIETSYQTYRAPLQEYEISTEHRISAIQGLQEQVKAAVRGDATNQTLLSLMEEMDSGRGSVRQLHKLTSESVPQPEKLVLHCDEKSLSVESFRSFIGEVVECPAVPFQQTARVQELFRCSENPDTKVHAICIDSHYRQVFVAYGGRGDRAPGWVTRSYQQNGALQCESLAITGRVCLSGLNLGWVRVEGEFTAHDWMTGPFADDDNKEVDRQYDVYNKGDCRFALRVYSSGHCDLRAVTIKAGRHTKDSKVCDVTTTMPVAFDVSEDGRVMAVVEKDQDGVMLYRHGQSAPFAQYRGNGHRFKPFDVCFYVIEETERLVVADWLNDSLHVLEVGEQCRLLGNLGSDCLLLVRPTALFADSHCLWVGCQGGHILSVHQS